MTRLLPILSLLLTAAAPAEAVRPGTYRKCEPRNYCGQRFKTSGWQIYTIRGWLPTWIEDHAQRRTQVNYRTRSYIYDFPDPCPDPVLTRL